MLSWASNVPVSSVTKRYLMGLAVSSRMTLFSTVTAACMTTFKKLKAAFGDLVQFK